MRKFVAINSALQEILKAVNSSGRKKMTVDSNSRKNKEYWK